MDQAAPSHQAVFWHIRECREVTNLDRGVRLRVVAIVKKRMDSEASLYTLLQIFSLTLFEKMPLEQAVTVIDNTFEDDVNSNQLNLFDF